MDNINPGDVILAGRGFNIQESVACTMTQIKMPAFTRGESQLSPVDIETTQKIAHVRIHVERVIGSVRQTYGVLNGQLPIDFLSCREIIIPMH